MVKSVALFATCLVDIAKPEIGFASIALLEAAGFTVSVPEQTCCGQANFNGGDLNGIQKLARQWVRTFESYDAIVIPSGSCVATIKKDYITVFERSGEQVWAERARTCASKTFELSSFLYEECSEFLNSLPKKPMTKEPITYHDSCSGLRSLGIKQAPRTLLKLLSGAAINECNLAESCCGFGGAFCIKQPEISVALADDKISSALETGAELIIGGDWGCLMHLEGRLEKTGKVLKVQHIAVYLSDYLVEQ